MFLKDDYTRYGQSYRTMSREDESQDEERGINNLRASASIYVFLFVLTRDESRSRLAFFATLTPENVHPWSPSAWFKCSLSQKDPPYICSETKRCKQGCQSSEGRSETKAIGAVEPPARRPTTTDQCTKNPGTKGAGAYGP